MLIRRISYVTFTLITVLHSAVFSQYTSINGNFEVDQVRGCPGLTINITNNSGIDCSLVGCDFDYKGDGYNSPPDEDIRPDPWTFTYDEPGTYDLYILFGTIEDFITITIEDKPEPDFQILTCSGNGVSIRVTDDNYDEYEIDFGDGSPPVTVPVNSPEVTYTYPNSATRTISVQGRDAGWANNCNPAIRSFTPVANLPAATINALTVTGDEEVTLDLGTSPDILYELYISTNGGPFNILRSFSDARSTEVVDLSFLANNYYCFRLDATDPCGGASVSSDEVCSIQLSASAQNNANNLTWQTNDPDADFQLFRDGVPLASSPAGSRNYVDSDVTCGSTYCYYIEAQFGTAVSRSPEICIDAENALPPAPVEYLSIIPDGNGIVLDWLYNDPSGNTTFDIYRSEAGSNPQLIGSTNDSTYIDDQALNQGFIAYCYEIVPRDACGNTNTSALVACTVRPDGTVSLRDDIQLNWPPYTGYSDGVAFYFIEKSYDGTTFVNHAQTADTVYTEVDNQDNQVVYYRVRIVSNNGDAADSYSYVVQLIKSNQLFYPDAFTPDGDGLNDVFEVSARYVTEFSMDIFNRWGELIFHTEDIAQGWDGSYRGDIVQQGTYIMKLRLVDEAGRETNQDASIFVVRR